MIAIQLGVGLADALLRLRASAYSSERPVSDVAADVVSRRLRSVTLLEMGDLWQQCEDAVR